MARMDEIKHKLGICVPYRNRKEHLERFLPHLSNHLTKQGIHHSFYFAHQVDEKLLNRGALKNIAAKAAFEDECDYIAWHDIDMLPYEEADYSYPDKYPIHIATQLSKYGYGMAYDQYFGGVILFTKEQVKKINGYSNEYWDWGMEDDDLFWRCYFEKLTTSKKIKTLSNQKVIPFNGIDTYISIPCTKKINTALSQDHTISITFRPKLNEDKIPIWLIGNKDRRLVELPILRKENSLNWGLSYNNTKAVSLQLIDKEDRRHYNWAKRDENQWTEIQISYSTDTQSSYLIVNGELCSQINGTKLNIPFPIINGLKEHDVEGNIILGYCPLSHQYFEGEISEFKIYSTNELIYKLNVDDYQTTSTDIDIFSDNNPYRRPSKFYCLPHTNEGYDNGKWIKGEATDINEKRLVSKMQKGLIDYTEDGINSVNYNVESTEKLQDNAIMLNVSLK